MLTIEQARLWYPKDDAVHGFDHVLRVYRLAELLANDEGAKLEIVRAAALLHDAQADPSGEAEAANDRSAHHHQSADIAQRALSAEGWAEEQIAEVLHCIRAHRFRDDSEAPQTLEAMVLFDADKLDAIGAIGVARAIAYSVQAGAPVYSAPSAQFMQHGQVEAEEAHSAYHEFLFKLVKIKERLYTASARRIAEERHRHMVDFFERLAQEMEGVD
jgi:uncharacterized protein